MGVVKIGSSSSFDSENNSNINPNPTKYRILREKRVNNFIILKINYPDCNNYEGNKILLYKDCTLLDIVNQKEGIDPHFSDNKNLISPIARFKPDDDGWNMAVFFAENFR